MRKSGFELSAASATGVGSARRQMQMIATLIERVGLAVALTA